MESLLSRPGSYYTIPYSIMVGRRIKNLLVTGRCVSAYPAAGGGGKKH